MIAVKVSVEYAEAADNYMLQGGEATEAVAILRSMIAFVEDFGEAAVQHLISRNELVPVVSTIHTHVLDPDRGGLYAPVCIRSGEVRVLNIYRRQGYRPT